MSELEINTSTELKDLEEKLDTLISSYDLIKKENNSLKTKQDELVKEKAKLLEKTTIARTRVEAMITRLKSMEHEA
jgi:cell division protein ZapB